MSNINESIVLVGGGGGVYRVARFLKHIRPNITTIQTVFDHGGHSGELRDDRGVLPPGDIRQAILALSDDGVEPILRKLLSFRFEEKGRSSLNGATVGNVLLTALAEIEGSLPLAINALCDLCKVRGKVLPVSLDDAELVVELSDQSWLKGEGHIDTRSIEDDRTIVRAHLEPEAHIFVEAYEALVRADKIVLCPGDVYTSLVPNLLVDGFADAVIKSQAQLIYCVNLMTKKAETHDFAVADFASVISRYLGCKLDVTIFNTEPLGDELVSKYAKEKSYQVLWPPSDAARDFSSVYVGANLVDKSGGVVRHNSRVASIIADL